jgi:hypothetical protein
LNRSEHLVDVMFPTSVLTYAIAAFQAEFANTPLRISVEALGAVIEPVLGRRCAFGIRRFLPVNPPEVSSEHLLGICYQMVVRAAQSIGGVSGPDPATSLLAQHVQLVHSDHSHVTEGKHLGVASPRTWRLSNLGAKHAFLQAGLGWDGHAARPHRGGSGERRICVCFSR